MGASWRKPKSTIVDHVWSCNDLIHEFMDQVNLKDISSISRIHRASSLAIFTYHFRRYHCCKYNSFILWSHNYSMIYYQTPQSIRPDYGDRLAMLRFYSVLIDSPLDDSLYLQSCLYTCISLRITSMKIFYRLRKTWNAAKIRSTIKELTITPRVGRKSRTPYDTKTIFPNVEKLSIGNMSYYKQIAITPSHKLVIRNLENSANGADFPATLESLTIGHIHDGVQLDLSSLLHLRDLVIRDSGEAVINVDLPDSLERLKLPPVFLMNKQKLPSNLLWFSCGYDDGDGRLLMPSSIDPGYFKNTNIRELHLWGFNIPWWNRFEIPASLQSIACYYWNLSAICKRVKSSNCSLKYVVLAIQNVSSVFRDFIAGRTNQFLLSWVCSDNVSFNPIRDKNNKKFHWYMLTIDEFEESKLLTPFGKNYLNTLEKFRLDIGPSRAL